MLEKLGIILICFGIGKLVLALILKYRKAR